MKNNKKIFFVLALLTLLIAVSTVNAVDDTTVADDTPAINDASSDTISAEVVQTGTNEQAVATKNIEFKNNKVLKNDIVIDGVTYTNIYEDQVVENNFRVPSGSAYFNNCTFDSIGRITHSNSMSSG